MDLENLGQLPISEDKRAGEDVRYEPEYEAVQQEIDKLSSPTATTPPDWEKVAKLSELILKEKSKDLIITTYLGIALFHLQGIQGLFIGTKILRDILYNFWDELYPPKKRMKGRKNALNWWKEEIEKHLKGEQEYKVEQNEKKALLKDLEDIDKFIADKLPDGPSFLNLKENLEEIITAPSESSIPPPSPPSNPPPSSPPPDFSQKPSPEPASAPEPAASEENSQALMEQGFSLLNKASLIIAKEKPYWPELFRLNRIVSWLNIEDKPMAEQGKTLLPPPDLTIINALKNLYQNQDWPALLETAEAYVPQFLFWLDLSRYSKEALENLGQNLAAKAIEQEVKWFLNKLPGIEQLCFSDNTPFADTNTQKWLKTLNKPVSSSLPLSDITNHDELFKKIDTIFTSIKENIKSKGLQETLLKLQKEISLTQSKREKIFWYIKLVNLFLEQNQNKLYFPYVYKILNFIAKYKLDEWEPELAVQGLVACLKVLQTGKDNHQDMLESIYDKLSLLNPAIVLNFL
ncbi:MAG: type secretion system protein VasJ [Desulfonauticus sp.]|nr:type secretion system protein VasJ [Desulfonauticus sp.]